MQSLKLSKNDDFAKKIHLLTSYNTDSDNKQVNSLGNGRFQIIFSQFDKSLFPDIHDELPV